MRRLPHLLPLMALVALPFVFHWKLFAFDLDDRKIFRGDFLNQHFVWKSYALSRVASGELPLWNPHVQGGIAFHANPQVGIFYPPTYLLLPFLDDGHVNYIALEAYQIVGPGKNTSSVVGTTTTLAVPTTCAARFDIQQT